MSTIEELKRERAKHAEELKTMSVLDEKRKVKRDIKKIKAAKFRTKWGLSSDKIDNMFKHTGKILKKSGMALGKGILGAGEAANRMYDQPQRAPPKKKKLKKKEPSYSYGYFN